MSEFPKDGSTFIVEAIDRQAYRWAKYKPDGARQMKKPGRWQKQVWSGDYFKWENCEEPVGMIAPAMEDGPISGAVKALAARDAEIERLRGVLESIHLNFHASNPSLAYADVPREDYLAHVLFEGRKLAAEALKEQADG